MQQLVSLVAQNVGLPSTANRAHKYQFIKVSLILIYVIVLFRFVLFRFLFCLIFQFFVLFCLLFFWLYLLTTNIFSLSHYFVPIHAFARFVSLYWFELIYFIFLILSYLILSSFLLSYLILSFLFFSSLILPYLISVTFKAPPTHLLENVQVFEVEKVRTIFFNISSFL